MKITPMYMHLLIGPMLAAVLCCTGVAAAEPLGPELPTPTTAVQPTNVAERISNKDAMPLGRPRSESEQATQAAASSRESTSPLTDPGNLTTLGSLLLVLALIGATAWVVKRASRNGTLMSALGAGGRAPAGILEVLGRYPISAGCTLVMLKVDRRILLLAQSGSGRSIFGARSAAPASMQVLSEITDPEDVASILMKVQDDESRAANERFQGLLGQAEREQTRIERRAERRGGMIDSVDLRSTPLATRRSPHATPHASAGRVTA